MAWDKVTKIDSIAKRKPRTKVNAGMLVEHVNAYHRVGVTTFADFIVPDTAAQRLVVIGKSGKIRRVTTHGHGSLVSNFASRSSARQR